LADAICKLIEDENLRKRMGVASRQLAQRFNLDTIMYQWEQLFHDVLNEN